MNQIREFFEIGGEFELAYEYIIGLLEELPFVLTSTASIKLLDVGLLMRFKTNDEKDSIFD